MEWRKRTRNVGQRWLLLVRAARSPLHGLANDLAGRSSTCRVKKGQATYDILNDLYKMPLERAKMEQILGRMTNKCLTQMTHCVKNKVMMQCVIFGANRVQRAALKGPRP